MKRLVHLIPYHDIGGVEVAARSLRAGCHDNLDLERHYLVKRSRCDELSGEFHGPNLSLNDPRAYLRAIWRLSVNPPDLLVCSLWRCAFILIVMKVLRPKMKSVLFLHLARDVHVLDAIANRVAMWLSMEIWADSDVTLEKRVSPRFRKKARTISFLLDKVDKNVNIPSLSPRFIFWGRLHSQKGLGRAIKIFYSVSLRLPTARFTIIGPDGGVEAALRSQVSELGLGQKVDFKGPLTKQEIAVEASRSSFYLQTSVDEGMAISVVEAMCFGLVPIVTPVGEISRYCRHKYNSLVVLDDDLAIDDIFDVISDERKFDNLSNSALQYWKRKAIYGDEFLNAAKSLLGQ